MAKKRILVVEQSEAFRDTLVKVLQYGGYRVKGESDPQHAASCVQEADLVVVSAMFGKGQPVLSAALASGRPIVVLSALERPDWAYGVGVSFFGKPPNCEVLLAEVERVLK